MRKILTIAGCLLVSLITVGLCYAEGGFVTSGAAKVQAGKQLDFNVKLPETQADLPDAYTVVIEIEPEEPAVVLKPKEGISLTRNYADGSYSVKSSELQNMTSIGFELKTDQAIREETEYTVNVSIVSTDATDTDDFSFTVLPKKEKHKGGGGSGVFPGGESGGGHEGEYRGEADNYLKSLSVAGYTLTQRFDKTRDTYFVNVGKSSDVSSLTVSAIPCDSTARVDIVGNSNISADMSKITVDVTADNGDARIYRIYVLHKANK